MLTTAKPSPYLIELCGGRYDGFRQPCDVVPLSTCLEMPGPEVKFPEAVSGAQSSTSISALQWHLSRHRRW